MISYVPYPYYEAWPMRNFREEQAYPRWLINGNHHRAYVKGFDTAICGNPNLLASSTFTDGWIAGRKERKLLDLLQGIKHA